MKQCNKCGASLPDDARFCGNCGEPVGDTQTESQNPPHSSEEGQQDTVQPFSEPGSYQNPPQGNPDQQPYSSYGAEENNYQQPYGGGYGAGQGDSYQQPQNPYGAPNGGYYGVSQPGQPVTSSTFLVLSILALLFCLPLGIPAIIFATKIDRANQEGRYQDALKAAKTCKVLLIVAGSLLAALIVFYVIFIAIFAGYAAAWY